MLNAAKDSRAIRLTDPSRDPAGVFLYVDYDFGAPPKPPLRLDRFQGGSLSQGMRVLILCLSLGLAACTQSNLPPEPENLCDQAGARCVNAPVRDVLAVDGDTFELQRLTDRGTERIRLRLIGWDSPETGNGAACAAEDALGQKVEARAKELFDAAQTLTFKPEGNDRFGRIRAHVYLDGTHIGWLLAKEGLSKPWLSETVKPVWCDDAV
ncbi:MAG: hypothetical protein Hens2KO_03830 [Henriciella sp.]